MRTEQYILIGLIRLKISCASLRGILLLISKVRGNITIRFRKINNRQTVIKQKPKFLSSRKFQPSFPLSHIIQIAAAARVPHICGLLTCNANEVGKAWCKWQEAKAYRLHIYLGKSLWLQHPLFSHIQFDEDLRSAEFP
jgi:hypothetical protein